MLEGIQAIAEATGMVKGKVGNPNTDPPLQPSGKLDVGGAVGRGQTLFNHHCCLSCFAPHKSPPALPNANLSLQLTAHAYAR